MRSITAPTPRSHRSDPLSRRSELLKPDSSPSPQPPPPCSREPRDSRPLQPPKPATTSSDRPLSPRCSTAPRSSPPLPEPTPDVDQPSTTSFNSTPSHPQPAPTLGRSPPEPSPRLSPTSLRCPPPASLLSSIVLSLHPRRCHEFPVVAVLHQIQAATLRSAQHLAKLHHLQPTVLATNPLLPRHLRPA